MIAASAPGAFTMNRSYSFRLAGSALALFAALFTRALAVPASLDEQPGDAADPLAALHAQFDPAERMLHRPFSSPGYHTTLTGGVVHRTRESLEYAVACLDTRDPGLAERAAAILDRVVDLQDRDPQSPTCGVWPWFLEEPLARMSPPDLNWADFCAVQLLEAVLNYEARLPKPLVRKIDAAIERAAREIQRRDVGPGYTNIAIMGSYVTLAAAERLHLADLHAYALERWRTFHRFTMQQGAFVEYNSPTYTVVALTEVGRIRRYIRDDEARRMAEEIYRVAWKTIALHFHPPTRQWAGPHSRSYSTLLGKSVLALLQEATGGQVDFGVPPMRLDRVRVPLPCPPDLVPHFQRLDAAATRVEKYQDATPDVIGTSYLAPAFTLGSVNCGSFWTQQHAVIAYWGKPETPAFLRVRFLHDGHDFAAAQVFTAQREGELAGLVAFATDGGDTHPSLDRLKGGTFQASDLRLRFEFGGGARSVVLEKPGSLASVLTAKCGGLRVSIAAPSAQFAQNAAHWETGRDRDTAFADIVLYSGTAQTFDLTKLDRAFVAFALRIGTDGAASLQPSIQADAQRIGIESNGLRVSASARPATLQQLRRSAQF